MNETAPQPVQRPRIQRRVPRWVFALLCIFGSAAATVIVYEVLFVSRIPPDMVGKWVVEGGEQEGSMLEFFRDGTVKATVKVSGKVGSVQWLVTMIDDENFHVTVGDDDGIRVTEAHTILELNDRHFVFRDSKGTAMKLVRSRPMVSY